MQDLLLNSHLLRQSHTWRIITKAQSKRPYAMPCGYRLYSGATRPGKFLDESRKLQRGCKLTYQLRKHCTSHKFASDRIPEHIELGS